MSFSQGEMVGSYRIVEQLGQGGMATVYKAYHASLDRFVALKVLHPAFLEDSNFLARFQREARVVAKLEHVNIVPIYDYSEHDGRPYLVMKFIEGETLKARMAREPIEPLEVVRIVEAVGAGLGYAHKHGILHRDIKPSNVLLANDGPIYLADFGLARIAQSGESTLTSDMILGTPQYISPEQAMGKKNLDEGTDIYSLGVMLYELTVGQVPFSADTPFSIIHDHIYTPLPLPSQVNPGVSEALERVLLKALAKERHDRQKDVAGLVDAFILAWKQNSPPNNPDGKSVKGNVGSLPTLLPIETIVPDQKIHSDLSDMQSPSTPANEIIKEQSLPVDGKQGPGVKNASRKIPWMWIAVLVIFFMCCLVTANVLRLGKQADVSVKIPTIISSTQTNDVFPLTPTAGKQLQVPTYPGLPALEQYIVDNPNDPVGYLNLSLAYVAMQRSDLVQEQVTKIEIAARGNETFYWEACGKFLEVDSWIAAARMCVHAAEIHAPNGQLNEDLREKMHESVYEAFRDQKAVDFISIDRLKNIDPPMAELSKARLLFFSGNQIEAQNQVNELRDQKPGFQEVDLFQAEMYILTQKYQDASPILNELIKEDTPEWIIKKSTLLLSQIP